MASVVVKNLGGGVLWREVLNTENKGEKAVTKSFWNALVLCSELTTKIKAALKMWQLLSKAAEILQ